jgi:hypothetical protein
LRNFSRLKKHSIRREGGKSSKTWPRQIKNLARRVEGWQTSKDTATAHGAVDGFVLNFWEKVATGGERKHFRREEKMPQKLIQNSRAHYIHLYLG